MNILACLYFYYKCGGFVDTCKVSFWGFVAHSLDTGNPEGVMHVCISRTRGGLSIGLNCSQVRLPTVRSMTTRHAGLETIHATMR
jgi:hypothetical protein